MNLKKGKNLHMEGFGRRIGKEKIVLLYCNLSKRKYLFFLKEPAIKVQVLLLKSILGEEKCYRTT